MPEAIKTVLEYKDGVLLKTSQKRSSSLSKNKRFQDPFYQNSDFEFHHMQVFPSASTHGRLAFYENLIGK